MKKLDGYRQTVVGSLLTSAVFSLFLNSTVIYADTNPAGAGLGRNPGGVGRVIDQNDQNSQVGSSAAPGSPAGGNSKSAIEFGAGFLGLDAVPDLHFFPADSGQRIVGLMNNTRGGYTGTEFVDGNGSGKLQVSDYRFSGTSFDPSTARPLNGWTLSAKLGYFSPIGGTGVSGAVSTDPNYNDSGAAAYGGVAPTTPPNSLGVNDWAIFLKNKAAADRNVAERTSFRSNVHLSAAPMYDYPRGSDVQYDEISTLIAGGPEVKIWWTPKSLTNSAYGGFGKTLSYYNTESTASLKVGNKAKENYYYAPITWTLMAGSN